MSDRGSKERHLKLAACAVAVVAAVGGGSARASASEMQAIDQIQRYCTTSWRNAGIDQQDWPDCTQQALVELLERVSRARLTVAIDNNESTERRELNRTVWRTIQRWRRSPRWAEYREGAAEGVGDRHDDAWEEVMSVARQNLTPRQHRILALTRDGWRVSEIAGELHISPARVSDEKYKAICKLRHHLAIPLA